MNERKTKKKGVPENEKGFSDAEVNRLIDEYRRDNELAFDRLAELYRPMLLASVASYGDALAEVYDSDDLMQYALIALSKAALTYNASQSKVSFGLYAKVCVNNSMISRARFVARRRVNLLPIENFLSLADTADVSDGVVDRESAQALENLMTENLSKLEYDVLRLYASGLSSAEIATRLSKSQRSVDNAIFRARKKLKSVLNGGSI
ncbi:MAG: sigma-70 family RNA polymerase sigma factor [Clostridia bacterium]|nr:sigma-70 family RNA polymerase sigma factor [Clostridia bacterium]